MAVTNEQRSKQTNKKQTKKQNLRVAFPIHFTETMNKTQVNARTE